MNDKLQNSLMISNMTNVYSIELKDNFGIVIRFKDK